MTLQPKHYLEGKLATKVFLSFCFAYLLSYAFRAVNAVIAPELVVDLHLNNADLGLLSAAYLISFAALQLPLGIWLDRYGSRRVEASLLLVAACGAALFASAHSLLGLWIGRALIGAGVSSCLMAAFTAYRGWFAHERQGQLASWMLVAGTSGALLTTVPVQMTLPYIGWRGVFAVMSGLTALAALGIFFGLPKARDVQYDASKEVHKSVSYLLIMRDPFFIRMAPIAWFVQGGFIAVQTLWLGPWLTTVQGVDANVAAQSLFWFNFTLLCAYLLNGFITPRLVKRGMSLIHYTWVGMGLQVAVLCLAILLGTQGFWWLWLGYALVASTLILGQSIVGLQYPSQQAGRANTAYNLMIFIGAFLMQWGLGGVIDACVAQGLSRVEAHRFAFGIAAALQIGALVWCWLQPKLQPATNALVKT